MHDCTKGGELKQAEKRLYGAVDTLTPEFHLSWVSSVSCSRAVRPHG